jgi:hypothetical protein
VVLRRYHVNDKDGTFAGILAAEIAAYAKDKGTTLFELLDGIYLQIGHYATANKPLPRVGSFEGAEGVTEKINLLKKAQEWKDLANQQAKSDHPFLLAGRKVIGAVEFASGRYDEQHYAGFPDEGIRFFFEDPNLKPGDDFIKSKNYITIRPSGTSQTIRFYTQIFSAVDKENIGRQKRDNFLQAEKISLAAQKELLNAVGLNKYVPNVDDQLRAVYRNYGQILPLETDGAMVTKVGDIELGKKSTYTRNKNKITIERKSTRGKDYLLVIIKLSNGTKIPDVIHDFAQYQDVPIEDYLAAIQINPQYPTIKPVDGAMMATAERVTYIPGGYVYPVKMLVAEGMRLRFGKDKEGHDGIVRRNADGDLVFVAINEAGQEIGGPQFLRGSLGIGIGGYALISVEETADPRSKPNEVIVGTSLELDEGAVVIVTEPTDGAMVPATAEQPAISVRRDGGINLNPNLLDLQIKRDGNGVPLPLPQQPIETMHIEGFLPIIINVTPVTNLPLLLGMNIEDQLPSDYGKKTSPDGNQKSHNQLKARELEEVSLLN